MRFSVQIPNDSQIVIADLKSLLSVYCSKRLNFEPRQFSVQIPNDSQIVIADLKSLLSVYCSKRLNFEPRQFSVQIPNDSQIVIADLKSLLSVYCSKRLNFEPRHDKTVSSGVSYQVSLKLACSATKASMSLELFVTESRDITLSR